ncbi:MAG: acyltransferase [Chitinophagaceae bacterium]
MQLSGTNMPVSAGAGKRIPELDGLRGMAILLVLSFHYINNELIHSTGRLGKVLAKLTSFGWVGVDLFFVLSGFLIGSILIRNTGSSRYFSSFYLRRMVRIIPNYYLLLLIFLVILSVPFFKDNYFLTGNNVIPQWSYFAMLHNFYMAYLENMGNTALSVTWSIGIEEQFYIVFPLVVYFVNYKWLPVILVAAIVAACFLRMGYKSWIPAYVLLPCRMDALSFGALVAWLNHYHDLQVLVKKYFRLLIAVIAADMAACMYLYLKYEDLGPVKNSLFAIVFAIMLVFALTLKESWYGKILRSNILVRIGTISYSLYLFHYLILGLFHHMIGNKQGVGIYNTTDLIIAVIAFIVSIIFSWVVFKFLETPMVNWGRRFKY